MLRERSQPGGPLMAHSRDALALPPEIMRLDLASVPITVAASGAISGDGHVSLHANYASELFGISGFCQEPAADAQLAPFLSFNLREDGRNFDLFTTPVEMAYLIGRTGGWGIWFPRAAYVFRPGARLRVDFRLHPGYVAQAPVEPRRWGVLLGFNLWRAK